MKKLILVSLLLLLFIPLVAEASFDNSLYYGLQNNSEVRELQEFLTEQGVYSGPATGNFYSLTLAGVKAFQQRENISPVAGYFGILTRARANEILSANVEPSNQQAVQETGTTPPAPTPQATTNDVIATLQAQIALLLQQVQAMQAQQTATQQIVQNTQQIVQNTTPTATPTCTPSWQCATWSACTNSLQTRTCADANGCGVSTSRPSLAQSCTVVCTPNWQCGNWTTCSSNQQIRTCTDSNNCGILTDKPSIAQSCTVACSPNWQCGSWSTCTNSQQIRTCSDSYSCGITTNKPNETQSCVVYFVADIVFDKSRLANNGLDFITATIKTKDSNGNIVPNKTVQIITDSTISATSNSNGEISTTIFTTGLPGSRKLRVSADGYSYDSNNYEVIGTGATAMGSVCFPQTGNLTRLMAPGKDQELLQIAQLRSLGITNLGLKKVSFKVSGIDSTWISNIRIQKYPPPCSEYFCYQGNISMPSNAVGAISSDGIISLVLANPLPINNDDRVYVYADLANPTSPRTGTTYTNEFISAEFTGMVEGYTSTSISFGAFDCMSTTDQLGDHETFISQIGRGN